VSGTTERPPLLPHSSPCVCTRVYAETNAPGNSLPTLSACCCTVTDSPAALADSPCAPTTETAGETGSEPLSPFSQSGAAAGRGDVDTPVSTLLQSSEQPRVEGISATVNRATPEHHGFSGPLQPRPLKQEQPAQMQSPAPSLSPPPPPPPPAKRQPSGRPSVWLGAAHARTRARSSSSSSCSASGSGLAASADAVPLSRARAGSDAAGTPSAAAATDTSAYSPGWAPHGSLQPHAHSAHAPYAYTSQACALQRQGSCAERGLGLHASHAHARAHTQGHPFHDSDTFTLAAGPAGGTHGTHGHLHGRFAALAPSPSLYECARSNSSYGSGSIYGNGHGHRYGHDQGGYVGYSGGYSDGCAAESEASDGSQAVSEAVSPQHSVHSAAGAAAYVSGGYWAWHAAPGQASTHSPAHALTPPPLVPAQPLAPPLRSTVTQSALAATTAVAHAHGGTQTRWTVYPDPSGTALRPFGPSQHAAVYQSAPSYHHQDAAFYHGAGWPGAGRWREAPLSTQPPAMYPTLVLGTAFVVGAAEAEEAARRLQAALETVETARQILAREQQSPSEIDSSRACRQ
jgi:hypothetical protein